jgi:hypothetical protein
VAGGIGKRIENDEAGLSAVNNENAGIIAEF